MRVMDNYTPTYLEFEIGIEHEEIVRVLTYLVDSRVDFQIEDDMVSGYFGLTVPEEEVDNIKRLCGGVRDA